MNRYFSIGKGFLKFSSQNDIAYIGNFWAELLSTFFYVVTFLLFTQLLFKRIGTMGSYTKDDFLFMSLVGQFTYYVWAQVIGKAITGLVENVRTGSFDFVLLRPISAKFYTYVSGIRPVLGLFISLPNIILFCIVIDWSNINLTISSVVLGAVVWINAMLILSTIMFTLAMPVFTQGDATDMVNVSFSLFNITDMPYYLLPKGMKFASFTVIPTLLATAGASYVMLGKGNPWFIVICSIVAGVVAVLCFNILWNKSLNSYSSASS